MGAARDCAARVFCPFVLRCIFALRKSVYASAGFMFGNAAWTRQLRGIHCAKLLHGFIGSEERLEFTVIGEPVKNAKWG